MLENLFVFLKLIKRQKFGLFLVLAMHILIFIGISISPALANEFSSLEVEISESSPSIDCDLPTISTQPTNQQICSGTTLNLTVISLNAVSYQWKRNNINIHGATSSTYSKTNIQLVDSGIYIVDVINTCGTISSNAVNVTITAAPILTSITYPQANYCNSLGIAAVTINGSNVSGGTFSVTPFGLALNPVNGLINPTTSASNIYTVTYTKAASGGCASVSTSTAVTINSNPTVGLSPSSVTICNGSSTILNASGAISYSWSPSFGLNSSTANTVIASPNSNQTYTVIGTNNSGCTGSATTTINVTPAPVLNGITYPLGNYCISSGNIIASINGTNVSGGVFTSSPAGLSINSSSGTINTLLSTAGSYTVTYTKAASGGCNQVSASTQIIINSNPSITINPSSSFICSGDSVLLNASGAFSYSWTPTLGLNNSNSATVKASPNATQLYFVNGTTSSGCTGSASVQITVTPRPVLTSISYPGTPFCTSIQSASVQLVGSNLSGGLFTSSPIGLSINSSTGLVSPGLSLPGVYTVNFTKTASGGCNAVSRNAIIEILQTPTISVTPNGANICTNSNVTLTASGANTYTWSPSVGLSSNVGASVIANPTSTLDYTVTGTSVRGCVNSVMVTVNVNTIVPLNINASASTNFTCPGVPFNLFTTSLSDTVLKSDFNTSSQGWTAINSSTNGNVPSSAWTIRPNGYVYTTTFNNNITFNSNDNSAFYLSNSDAQGLGGNTLTTLVSPAFSTIGYATLQLKFYHFYRYSIGAIDRARVEASTDSINWNTLTTFSSTIGASNSFALSTIDLSSYAGNPKVYIRFRYTGDFAWYWAVDNVSITGTFLGGENIYTWTSNPTEFYSEDKNPTEVIAQQNTIYTVTATNQLGCTTTSSVAMEVQNIDPVLTISDTTLCSPNSINIGVIDTGMYVGGYPFGTTVLWLGYAISGPPNTTINSNLGSTFIAEVTLPNGCVGLSNVVNVNTRSVVVNSFVTDANCNLNNGKVRVTISTSPVLPFRYVWKIGNAIIRDVITNSINDSIINLSPGTYTLNIYDNYGNSLSCETSTLSFNVDSIVLPQLSLNATTTSCYGSIDGMITSAIVGGQAPYSYLWSNGSTQSTINNLSVGLYTLTVTDFYGCSIQDTISVEEPLPITIVPSITNSCDGTTNGSILVQILNISAPYTATWYNSNFEFIGNGFSIDSLAEGDYNLFVQEDSGTNCSLLQILHVGSNSNSTNEISLQGCDRINANGINYYQGGIYTQTLVNQFGCDSILTLNLTIKQSSSSSTVITSCDSLSWNDSTYYISGTYSNLFVNSVGCDSFAVLNLTINQSTSSISAITACDSLSWNDSTYYISGTYSKLFVNSVGCDSVAVLDLTINQSTSSISTITACDSLSWNDSTYYMSGTYSKLFVNSVGCDSVAVLNLTINQSTSSISTITACDSLSWNDSTYYMSGTYSKLFVSSVGCDSVAVLNLTINQSTSSISTIAACDSLSWNDSTYFVSGTYSKLFVNLVGCDSLAILNLTIYKSTNSISTITACDSLDWNDSTYYISGTYSKLFVNSVGCDSVATLNLIINQSQHFYNDQDGDGFGYGIVIVACEQPIQTSNNNLDCNDLNALINPTSIEICENNIDDNCSTVIDENCNFSLNIKLFIQGFYNNGRMVPVLYNNGISLDSNEVDSITIELHEAISPYNKVAETIGVLKTDGSLKVVFSSVFQNNSFYIVIKQRNSIETWSKFPIVLEPFLYFAY